MPKQYLNPETLFPSLQYGFSQVVTSSPGKLVFMSGQVAWDAEQQIVGPGDLRAQTWQALSNVERAVQAAGGSLEDVVSMRIYIVKEQLMGSAAIRDGLQEFFPEGRPPATTWIGVESLANEAFLVEIEATAVIES
jgi:enamine deaminase RidA (YjgF/YER057c/UK114 family)